MQVHDSLHAVIERLLQGLNSGTVADSQHWLNGQLVQQDQPEVLLMVLGSQVCMLFVLLACQAMPAYPTAHAPGRFLTELMCCMQGLQHLHLHNNTAQCAISQVLCIARACNIDMLTLVTPRCPNCDPVNPCHTASDESPEEQGDAHIPGATEGFAGPVSLIANSTVCAA